MKTSARSFVVSLFAWLGLCVLFGQQVRRPVHHIRRASKPILIDGKLNESDWRVPTVGPFVFPWWKSGEKEQTEARMLWDDDFLYVSFRCRDRHIRCEERKRDGRVYKDDCVEVFTSPNPDRPRDYFNIEMNARGVTLEQHHPDGPASRETPSWDPLGIKIATRIVGTLNNDRDIDSYWILEAAIPLRVFEKVAVNTPPKVGDKWRLNLNRLGGQTNRQYSQWSASQTKRPQFHSPEDFGTVVFSANRAVDARKERVAYEPQTSFAKLPSSITLGRCSAVAINSRGHAYLLHRGKNPVIVVDQEGKFLRAFGDDLIGSGHGLRIDPHDNVWLTDTKRHVVRSFSPTGKLLLTLGTVNKSGVTDATFDQPTDVAFGPSGELFVTDGYGNNRVVKFSKAGKFIKSWGSKGSQPGQFNLPHAIIADQQGRLIVGDRENDRIQVFDREGKLLAVWHGVAPFGLAQDSTGNLFVADGRAHRIARLDERGAIVQFIGKEGLGIGQFQLPHMLSSDAFGNLYVAEVHGQRFQKLEPRRK